MYNKHMVRWLKTIKNDKQASLLIKIFNDEDSYLAHFSKRFPTLTFEDACSLANKEHLTSILIDAVLAVFREKYNEDGKFVFIDFSHTQTILHNASNAACYREVQEIYSPLFNAPSFSKAFAMVFLPPDHWCLMTLDTSNYTVSFGDSHHICPTTEPTVVPLVKKVVRFANTLCTTFSTSTISPTSSTSCTSPKWSFSDILPFALDPRESCCGVVALNFIEHALSPDVPLWTPSAFKHHRLRFLKILAGCDKVHYIGTLHCYFHHMFSLVRFTYFTLTIHLSRMRSIHNPTLTLANRI